MSSGPVDGARSEQHRLERVCVFSGSSFGHHPEFEAATRKLGETLVARGLGLVYGGSHLGNMGALADTVLECGGEVIGVIPEVLQRKEASHQGLTELRVVAGMHARKAEMAELADAFVALPGGLGTMEELLEVLTWAQLGMHGKPCGLLNVRGYYDHLVCLLDTAVSQGFLKQVHRSMLQIDTEPDRLIDAFSTYQAPRVDKWITRDST
jgi:uncharacterized protein (TIGR00730 family)